MVIVVVMVVVVVRIMVIVVNRHQIMNVEKVINKTK